MTFWYTIFLISSHRFCVSFRLGETTKDVFHYLFDFGDDWWHRIRVEGVMETDSNDKRLKLIKAFGAAPPQYYDEEDDGEAYDDYE